LQPSRWDYHWLEADSPLNTDFLLPNIKADMLACGVVGGVLMEATNHPQEIDWLLEISHASHMPMGVIGWIPPNLHQELSIFAKNSRFRGIRLNWLEPHPNSRILTPLLQACEAHGLVVDVLTNPDHLHAVANLIADYPHIMFVLDHMGGIDMVHITPKLWQQSLQPLAELPNVIGKISGFSTLAIDHITPTIRPLVEIGLTLFGSERLLFGSNIPFGLNQIGYKDIVASFRDAINHLPQTIQADICHKTAQRIYQLFHTIGAIS